MGMPKHKKKGVFDSGFARDTEVGFKLQFDRDTCYQLLNW